MEAVIFGGEHDGKVVHVTEGATTYAFPLKVQPPYKSLLPDSSPFGSSMETVKWNITVKRAYWTEKKYLVIVEPSIERWIYDNIRREQGEGNAEET